MKRCTGENKAEETVDGEAVVVKRRTMARRRWEGRKRGRKEKRGRRRRAVGASIDESFSVEKRQAVVK